MWKFNHFHFLVQIRNNGIIITIMAWKRGHRKCSVSFSKPLHGIQVEEVVTRDVIDKMNQNAKQRQLIEG